MSAATESPFLAVEHVHKTYQRGEDMVAALTDVTFTLESGCFAALAGPSGSGKSSLLNIIGTLDRPDAGTVRLAGRMIAYDNPSALEQLRRSQYGFVFQSFNLLPALTAVENVELPLFMTSQPATRRRKRAIECLSLVGLGDRLHHYPRQLSGGQQQRVAVARALVGAPELVLADEPTANLDSATADRLLSLMGSLNEQYGVGFLFSTHDPRILDAARTVIRLHDGRFQV